MSEITITEKRLALVCDFCCKEADDVEVLIAGPKGNHICSECVEIGIDIVKAYREAQK